MDKDRQYRNLFALPKKWQNLRANPSHDTGASWSPRQKIRGGTDILANLKENDILSNCKSLSSIVLRHNDISSDRAITAWTVEERRKHLPLPRYIRQLQDSHQDHIGQQVTLYLQSSLPVV